MVKPPSHIFIASTELTAAGSSNPLRENPAMGYAKNFLVKWSYQNNNKELCHAKFPIKFEI
jgi:hypothetical protein